MVNFSAALFAILIAVFATSAPAYAYLDGASVSIAMQAVIGTIASVLVFGKFYWNKFKSLFRRKKSEEQE